MRKILFLFMVLMTATVCFVCGNSASASASLSAVNVKTQKEYNVAGKVTLQTFVDADGNPVMADGYSQIRFTYHQDKKLVKMEYLDLNGNAAENQYGVSVYKQVVNRRNLVVEKQYLNLAGKYVNGPEGFAHEKSEATPNKRYIIETWRYDADGKPVSSDAYPAHYKAKTGKKYEMPNTLIEEAYYDQDGNLMPGPKGWARSETKIIAGTTHKERTAYYDKDGKLYFNKQMGYTKVEYKYKYGRLSETAYYDENEDPVIGPQGYAKIKYSYQRGNIIVKELYYDDLDNPVKSLAGYYGVEKEKFRRNQIVRQTFFGEDGKVALNDDGYAQVKKRYSIKNKVLSETYYNENLKRQPFRLWDTAR